MINFYLISWLWNLLRIIFIKIMIKRFLISYKCFIKIWKIEIIKYNYIWKVDLNRNCILFMFNYNFAELILMSGFQSIK